MRRKIVAGLLPAALVTATLLTLSLAGGAAAAPPRLSPPTPPEAPPPPTAASQAWLGVELQDIDAQMAEALDLPDGEGALVNRVVDGSPAAAAGLTDGDVIIGFDGESVRDADALTAAVRDAKPGARASVVIMRDGRKQTIKVELGSRKTAAPGLAPGLDRMHQRMVDRMMVMPRGRGAGGDTPMMWTMGDEPKAFLGILMTPLTEQLGRFFGAPDGEGVLVSEVIADSPAARAGIEAGDVILRADERAISDPSDVRGALSEADPGDQLDLAVLRDHTERTFTVTLGEPSEDPHAGMMWHDMRSGSPGAMYLRQHRKLRGDDESAAPDADNEHQVIIRRFSPQGGQGDDNEALREELQQLRQEVERLREEVDRQR